MSICPKLFGVCLTLALLGVTALATDLPVSQKASSGNPKLLRIPGHDFAPMPLRVVHPCYPYDLRREGVEGVVTVDLLVDARGLVVQTELVSTTEPQLNHLALEAASQWTFIPTNAKGKNATARVRVPFEFVMPQLLAAHGR